MARRVAIDTMVLSHALGLERIGVSTDWRDRAQACDQLLTRLSAFEIPAPVVAEFLRFASPHEASKMNEIFKRARVISVPGPAGALAGRLLARVHGVGGCPTCGEPPGTKSCAECKRHRGPASRFADALIAASLLHYRDDHWTFYTYNERDFTALFDGEARVTVMQPPPYESSTPLLDLINGPRASAAQADRTHEDRSG